MQQKHFRGPEWDKTRHLRLVEQGAMITVLVNGQQYMSWPSDDELTPRVAIIQLDRLGIGSQEELAEVFGIHPKSVYNYVQAFSKKGALGLIAQKRGPRGSWKLTPRIRGKILYLAFGQGIVDVETIKRRLAQWGEQIGSSSIRAVLLENGVPEAASFPEAEADYQRQLFENQESGQLHFQFPADSLSAGGVMSPVTTGDTVGRREEEQRRESTVQKKMNDRSVFSRSQRAYLNRLERGEYSTYAGGLLFTALLERYSYLPILKRVVAVGTCEGYSLEELCLTLLYVDLFGFRSMEDFKRVYAEEFGILIGRLFSPSHFTLRRFLHRVREMGKSEELTEEFACEYLKQGLAGWGVMYIDGHFLPYYGLYAIWKGWHGVRKIPMKGSYHFLAVDERFVPWIFLIRSSEEDLLEKIPELIEKAKTIGKRAGLSEKQLQNLVVVFDREGYSGKLYRYLDGRDEGEGKRRAFFVTWSKYSRWVYDLAEDRFDRAVTVRYEMQKERRFLYYQTDRLMSKYGKIRAIVVQRQSDKRRACIYTNATEEELESERVVRLICRRWGEENLIKTLMGRHFINYSPGYVYEPLEHQPLVENPQVTELKQKKGGLKSELNKLKVALTDKMLGSAEESKTWEEIKRNEIALIADIVKLQNEIFFIDEKIAQLPATIPYDQAHGGERLHRLNYEKKRFLDCIKVFSYNMQRKMCEVLLKYYGPSNEVLPTLSMIVNRGGHLKLEDGRLRVRMRRFKNPEIDYAARHLCEELNAMNPKTLDRFEHPLYFEVQ